LPPFLPALRKQVHFQDFLSALHLQKQGDFTLPLAIGYFFPPRLSRGLSLMANRKGSADLLLQKVSRAFFALNIGLDATANLQTIRSPKQEQTKWL